MNECFSSGRCTITYKILTMYYQGLIKSFTNKADIIGTWQYFFLVQDTNYSETDIKSLFFIKNVKTILKSRTCLYKYHTGVLISHVTWVAVFKVSQFGIELEYFIIDLKWKRDVKEVFHCYQTEEKKS